MMMKKDLYFALFFSLAAALVADAAAPTPGDEYQPLFNGVNLVGWMVTNGHATDWRVEGGEMVVDGRSPGGATELRTARKYGAFELRLEFQMSEGGNSGVFLRMGEEDPGLEIQLLDDYAPKHADLKDWQYTGALYGMAPPDQRVSRKAGEWQEMVIRLQGQRLSVALNGSWIVNTDLDLYDSTETEPRRRPSIRRTEGYVGLQNYGTKTRFRNLSIRSLDQE